MKVKSKSNVNVKLPVLCRISYEDAFKLSLFGDLSEFESIANVKAMSENNEIIKFVPELRQELNVFLDNKFRIGCKPIELQDEHGNHIRVKAAKGNDGKILKKTIEEIAYDENNNRKPKKVVYYGYEIQASKGKFGKKSKKKIIYSFTSPEDIYNGLTRYGVSLSAEYAKLLSSTIFSTGSVETINSSVGGIIDFEHRLAKTGHITLKDYLRIKKGTNESTSVTAQEPVQENTNLKDSQITNGGSEEIK